jgi:hypothetical protein
MRLPLLPEAGTARRMQQSTRPVSRRYLCAIALRHSYIQDFAPASCSTVLLQDISFHLYILVRRRRCTMASFYTITGKVKSRVSLKTTTLRSIFFLNVPFMCVWRYGAGVENPLLQNL